MHYIVLLQFSTVIKLSDWAGRFGAAASIGVVYGNTSNYFHDLHERVKESHENGNQDTKYTIPTIEAELSKSNTGPLEVTKDE